MRKYFSLLVMLSVYGEFASAQSSTQTRTATLFNYNLAGNLVTNYSRNAKASDVQFDDNIYASTKKLSARSAYSLLVLEGFGFNIPNEATIENISVTARRFKTGMAEVKETSASLVRKRENPNLPDWWEQYAVNWADANYSLPAIETAITYAQAGTGTGGNGQPYEWTPARVNDPYFGVLFQTSSPTNAISKGNAVISYDIVEITVQYSQTPPIANRSADATETKPLKQPIVYPNPFTSKTNIQFTAAESGKAVVELYNINGTKVRSLFSGNVILGQVYIVTAGDAQLPKGIYVYKVSNGKQMQTGRLIKLD